MGACSSGEATSAEGYAEEPEGFEDARRVTVDKKTDEVIDHVIDKDRPTDDFFDFDEEVEEAAVTKEFLAVKPWIGAVKEPDDHPPVNKSPPDETYELEYVYGYRCEDSRQNVYYNPDGKIVYMTACLGVILDQETNTQTFFGGGKVDNTSKQVANDLNHHTNDIMSLCVNTAGSREWAVSGQVGKWPPVFMWNTQTGEKRNRIKLEKGARAVAACAVSSDARYIATVDKHNDHNVKIFDGNKCIFGDKGGPDPIFDICFSRKEGAPVCYTAGKKHFAHWDTEKQRRKKGLFGSNPRCSFACVTADDKGQAYAGGSNSLIYVFAGNTCKTTLGFHGSGFVGAIIWIQGKLYSGGRDGRVVITDSATLSQEKAFDFGVLPRAIDSFNNEKFIVGLRNGSIVECNVESGEQTTLMQSHNDGEVWGLDMDTAYIYTSGDDNQVKKWCPNERKCLGTAMVNEERRKAKRNRASTLGSYPDSQSSRAVAVNNHNGHIAVCANDGSVTIRTLEGFQDPPMHELRDSLEWIETAEYSPDGNWLAAGSHDTNIYIYDVNNGYALASTCKKHNAALTCMDWSMDSTYLRSVCNGYELLFYIIPSGDQDPSGASNTTGTVWASQHCKFGWCVDGVFPRETDGSHINGVDMNEQQNLITTGDDFGLVNVFRNPCRKGSVPTSYRGHSEHVVRVKFGRGDLAHWLFSIGGYDQTVMQWKLC